MTIWLDHIKHEYTTLYYCNNVQNDEILFHFGSMSFYKLFSVTVVVHYVNKCRMTCITKVYCAYIEQNPLATTRTASVKAMIGPAVCYAGVHTLPESVHQNCV